MDYARRLPPGPNRLTIWLPDPAISDLAATLPADDRPLTSDQFGRLRQAFEPPVDDGSAPWIAVTTRLADADEASISGMWRRFFSRHESLRATYQGTCDDDGNWKFTRHLIPVDDVRLYPHDLGTYADRHAAWSAITDQFAQWAVAPRWPSAALVTVQDGPDAIVFAAFDHVTFDGYSAYLTIDELPHLHRNERAGRELEAPAGSYLDFAVAQRTAQRALTPEDACLQPWRDALTSEGTLPGLPAATRMSRDMALPHVMALEPLATPAQTASFVSFCKDRYVPVGLGFSTLLMHAIQAEETHDTLTVLMSTHNRDEPQNHHAIGWFAGVAPLTVDLPSTVPLAQAMHRVTDAWVRSTGTSILTVPLVNELLGAKVTPSLVLSYLDAHRCPGWQDWTANGAEVLLGPIPASDQIHLWLNVMPDQTELLFRIPGTQDCQDWIQRVVGRMRIELDRIHQERTSPNQKQEQAPQ